MVGERLAETQGHIKRSGVKNYVIARQMGMSPGRFSSILNGSDDPPPGFEAAVMKILYPEMKVCSQSDTSLRDIADKLGIFSNGLTRDQLENAVISRIIPQMSARTVVLSTGETRRALVTAAIEIFNSQHNSNQNRGGC